MSEVPGLIIVSRFANAKQLASIARLFETRVSADLPIWIEWAVQRLARIEAIAARRPARVIMTAIEGPTPLPDGMAVLSVKGACRIDFQNGDRLERRPFPPGTLITAERAFQSGWTAMAMPSDRAMLLTFATALGAYQA